MVYSARGDEYNWRVGFAPTTIAFLLLIPLVSGQPSLRITSPRDGTLVHPGESISIKVEAVGKFQQVAVIGWDPIGSDGPLSAPPYNFKITVPRVINPGKYSLTATGFTGPGKPIDSEPILLIVEFPDQPMAFKVQPSLLRLSIGEKGYLLSYGVFPDGLRAYLEKSDLISFASGNPKVATVDHRGVVTALNPGSTTIKVSYRDSHVEIPLTVLADK